MAQDRYYRGIKHAMTQTSQSSEQPLLTIAIPTYNRARYLRESLAALFDELVAESRVELIVSDNASHDETPSVVREFQERGLGIRYIRNETNLGSSMNILQCFEQASGKYVWILGDDDIVLAGCVKQIMVYLERDDYDMLYLVPYGFDNDPMAEYLPDPLGREVAVIESADLFVRKIGTMFTLISCNILNKERLLTIEHRPFIKFTGTNLIQLSWTYPLLTRFSKGLIVYHRFLAIRNGTSGGYSVSHVFGEDLRSVTDELLVDHPRLAKLIYCSAITGLLPFVILKIRQHRHGAFEIEDFHKTLRFVYGNYYQYWLYVFPVAKSPLWLARIWFGLVRKVNYVKTVLRFFYFSVNRLIRVVSAAQ